MEIKINSYSSQSSLISSLLCFIIGGILYTYAEVVLNFTSIAIGVVLSIVGVFSLITFYMDYKKGEIKKGKLLIGILTIVLAVVFLIFQNLVETLLGLTVGGWVLFVGVLRLISALRLNLKTKRFFINLVISLLLIILGIYTIANGGLLLEGAGILMMVSSGIEIIGYIVNKILDKGNTTVVTETTVEEEVILTLPKLEKEEPVKEKEEVKLINEEASPKKPKRRGRKKKSVKDVEAKETKKTTKK
ncbi:MAG: DUF308 domain-containing protein [Candidatus Coprovivens sp.]